MQSSSYTTQNQVSASQHQRSLINIQETEQVQQEIAKLTRDMQELTQANNYPQPPPRMLATEDAKSSNDDDSSSLSNSASESDPGKPQQQSESEELSAVNISG